MSLKALDTICVRGMVSRERVSFECGGQLYTGTAGPRDTMRELGIGAVTNDQEFSILVPTENIDAMETPPVTRDVISVSIDEMGIPCFVDDEAKRTRCRITKIGRSLAGLTYTLMTAQKG